jgi:hypothetical protein
MSPLPRSETEWGRLGGGGSQQRHPEQSDDEIRGLNQEPLRRAPDQHLIVEHRLGYVLLGVDRPNEVRARRGSRNWWGPFPPFVTGCAGATFPRASIHGCSPTVGLFTSPPSRAGWPSISEVGVGVRVPQPGLSWEVWSLPPSVLGASAESSFPSKGEGRRLRDWRSLFS